MYYLNIPNLPLMFDSLGVFIRATKNSFFCLVVYNMGNNSNFNIKY